MAPQNNLGYWIGFNKVSGIGAARLQALLDTFGDLEAAWWASPVDLQSAGLDRRSLANLVGAARRLRERESCT